jgi:hypothetical protein
MRRIQTHFYLSEGLVRLGSVLTDLGRQGEGVASLSEALAIAEESGLLNDRVRVTIRLALLGSGQAESAASAFEARDSRLMYSHRIECAFLLWKLTGDRAHIEKAHRLLVGLQESAPAEYRQTMISNVPLYRDIQAAWATGPVPAPPDPSSR